MINNTINGTHISVIPKNEQQMVFVNGGIMPYFMAWDWKQKKWHFISADTPPELNSMVNEISNIIINLPIT